MQRSSVDLPAPDGPQMTMRSPRATCRLMSRSTWNSPYHLLSADDLHRGPARLGGLLPISAVGARP